MFDPHPWPARSPSRPHRQPSRPHGFLEHWTDAQPLFIKVFPHEYKARAWRRAHTGRLHFPARHARHWSAASAEVAAWVRSLGFFRKSTESSPRARKAGERIKGIWVSKIYEPFPEEKQREQGARCMDCGVPFCHTGCPVNNLIPDWNDLVYNNRWQAAISPPSTPPNNFPRVHWPQSVPLPARPRACSASISRPFPSSSSSALSSSAPGTRAGFAPSRPSNPPASASPLFGSGPAGLARRANSFAALGHSVTVFEKKRSHSAGLLRYGIPNFKL